MTPDGQLNLQRWTKRLCLATYLVIITVLTYLRHDLSLRTDEISKLLEGQYRPAAVGAFVLLGAGSLLLASHTRHRDDMLAAALAVYAASVLVVGLTSSDGVLHGVSALTAFVVVPIGMYRSHMLAIQGSLIWLVLTIASVATWPLLGFGIGERITVYLEVLWLLQLTTHKTVTAGWHPHDP